MEDAFALRCSEKETVLVAAGKTIAVERNKGVIIKAMMVDVTNAIAQTIMMIFRFAHKKTNKLRRC
jgi:hypothetical protein